MRHPAGQERERPGRITSPSRSRNFITCRSAGFPVRPPKMAVTSVAHAGRRVRFASLHRAARVPPAADFDADGVSPAVASFAVARATAP